MIKQDDRETHEQCCRYMLHKTLNAGDIVFEEEVKVTSTENASMQNNLIQINKKIKKPKELKTSKNQFSNESNVSTQRNSPVEKTPTLDFSKLKKIKVLTAGAAFGELALMEKKPRAATVRCETECHFALLEKEHFNGILKEKEEKNLFQQIDFLYGLKLFSSWSYHSVKMLFLALEQVEFQKNKAVYHEGDPSDHIYIIKSGEFKIMKVLSFLKKPGTLQKEMKSLEYGSGNYALGCLKNPFELTKMFEVAILQRGDFFGEMELLNNQKRKVSVVCNSSVGVLYVLNKEEFNKRISNDEKTFKILLEHITHRSEYFGARIRKFISTTKEMQESLEKKQEIPIEKCADDSVEAEFLTQKPLPEKKRQKEPQRRLNFTKTMIHPEDVIKTLKSSVKMKALGFGSGANSPKQNFFMLKAFAKYQEKEQEMEISPDHQKKQRIEKKIDDQIKNHQSTNLAVITPTITSKYHRKVMTLSLNSFIHLPINNEKVVDFLRNTEFPAFKKPKLRNQGLRCMTADTNFCNRIKTDLLFQEEKLEKFTGEKIELPLKYKSLMIKSKAKKSLRKYLQLSPTNTQYLKTISCFTQNKNV